MEAGEGDPVLDIWAVASHGLARTSFPSPGTLVLGHGLVVPHCAAFPCPGEAAGCGEAVEPV